MRFKCRILKEPGDSYFKIQFKILGFWSFLRSWHHAAYVHGTLDEAIQKANEMLMDNERAADVGEISL